MWRIYAGITLVCFLLAGVAWCNVKKRWEAEFRAKAIEQVQTDTKEVQEDAAKRAEKVKTYEPGDYLKYWDSQHGVLPPDSGGGSAAPAGKAPPAKP